MTQKLYVKEILLFLADIMEYILKKTAKAKTCIITQMSQQEHQKYHIKRLAIKRFYMHYAPNPPQ